MELKIKEYQLPGTIEFNYQDLKKELEEKVSIYASLVYTDDQIKSAKSDKANLNKLKKALNDERIRREKEYMIPFNDFKSKINEIISIIDKPVMVIDNQVKAYEEQQKQEKNNKIQEYWNSIEKPEGLALEEIFDSKWLNASVSMKSIQDTIQESINKFNQDMSALENLPEYSFEAKQVYISSLDLSKALNEAHRLSEIAKKKAEYEAERAKRDEEERIAAAKKAAEPQPQPAKEDFMNQPVEAAPAKEWVSFKCLLSVDDATALGEFFKTRNISFEQI